VCVALNFTQSFGASCVAFVALRALRQAGNRPSLTTTADDSDVTDDPTDVTISDVIELL